MMKEVPTVQHITQKPPVSLEIYHGLWRAMIAKALVELHIPDLLDGQKAVTELAEATRTSPIKLARFLRAAASCQFIRQIDDELFTASEQTAAMCIGQPIYYLISHLFNRNTIAAWNRLSENLAEEEPAINAVIDMPLWEFLDANPQQNEHFNGAMTVLSGPINSLISHTYPDWSGTIVDVGGGEGSLVRTIVHDHPEVRGIVFDREQALPGQEELGDRCTCVAGSFLETVPQADIYLFKNVLHNWSNEDVLKIFKNVRAAAPDGKILIAELLIAETDPSFAVCSLDLLMMVENGGCQRTASEFKHLLEQAGFSHLQVLPVGRSPYSLIEAR